MRVYVQLLGSSGVYRGESWHPFRPDQRFQLLAYLAYCGDPMSRDRAAFLFWPDAHPHKAGQNLRTLLYRVRALEWPELEVDAYRVRWPVMTDVAAFRQALTASRWDEALSLYAGPLLKDMERGEGAEFSSWLALERGRLHASWREAVLRRAEMLTEAKQDAGAGELLSRLLAEDEFDEEAVQGCLAALARAGRPLEALKTYRVFAQRLQDELGIEPTSATQQLAKAAQNRVALTYAPPGLPPVPPDAAPKPAKSVPGRLPTPVTSFVGRDLELAEIGALLAKPECRLLTLTGAGGVGKTRVALQVAEGLRGAYRDGAYFASLDALSSPESIPSTLAAALELPLQGAEPPLVQVVRHLAEKHVLLTLDNYEHLLDGATLTSDLLCGCPELKLLVTSRERLNLEEEWVFPLEGLSYPAGGVSPERAAEYEAVRLFVTRAQRVSPGFALTETDLPHVLSVCRSVQGLPLGLELAAVWVRALSVQEISRELGANLDLLRTESRNVVERHRSVRAAFEGSWRLLSPAEQEVLRKLSVFRGGFQKRAAAYVADASVAVLAALVDKSLLRVGPHGRYGYHPLLQQYVQERLAEHLQEQALAREKHGRYHFRFLEARSAELTGMRQREGLSAITEELENIRAAWGWAVGGKRVDELRRSASLLSLFYEMSGRFQEGAASFGAAVKTLEGAGRGYHETLSRVLLEYACHNYRLSHFARASQAAERGLELARAASEDDLAARNLDALGQIAWQLGEFSTSLQHLREALALAEARNDVVLVASLVRSIGWVENKRGNYIGAKRHLLKALSFFQQLEMPHEVVNNLNALGHLHVNAGYPSEAQPFFEEGLRLARETGAQVMVPHLLSGVGLALYEVGSYSEAQAVLKRALDETANELAQAWVLVVLGRTATATADYVLAQNYLEQALKTSWTARQLPEVLDALVASSELRIKQGRVADAVVTLHIAVSHSATTGYSRALAQRLLKDFLDPAAFTAVNEDPQSDKAELLEEVVGKILG